MYSKKIFFLGFTFSVLIAAGLCYEDLSIDQQSVSRASNNLVAGNRDPDDHLGYQGYVIRLGIFNTILNVERTFEVNREENITQVLAYDRSIGGRGASAELIEGGPNENFVTIKFTSQRGAGILHQVQIYSK